MEGRKSKANIFFLWGRRKDRLYCSGGIPLPTLALFVVMLPKAHLTSHSKMVYLHGKASVYNAGDLGLIPGLGRSPREGNGNPLQYSCLENPREGGAWWAAIYGVAQSQTQLK